MASGRAGSLLTIEERRPILYRPPDPAVAAELSGRIEAFIDNKNSQGCYLGRFSRVQPII